MLSNSYEYWTVIGEVIPGSHSTPPKVLCRCRCGIERLVIVKTLTNGTSKSCGCFKVKRAIETHTRHAHNSGEGKSATYLTWDTMVQRCTNPRHPSFRYYGGRGIILCPEWESFEKFVADMGERPIDRTLDRIDPNGPYHPANCKWATKSEQSINQRPRRNKILVSWGVL